MWQYPHRPISNVWSRTWAPHDLVKSTYKINDYITSSGPTSLKIQILEKSRSFDLLSALGLGFAGLIYMVKLYVFPLSISCKMAAGSRGLVRCMFDLFAETSGDAVFFPKEAHHVFVNNGSSCLCSLPALAGPPVVTNGDILGFIFYYLEYILKRCFPSSTVWILSDVAHIGKQSNCLFLYH